MSFNNNNNNNMIPWIYCSNPLSLASLSFWIIILKSIFRFYITICWLVWCVCFYECALWFSTTTATIFITTDTTTTTTSTTTTITITTANTKYSICVYILLQLCVYIKIADICFFSFFNTFNYIFLLSYIIMFDF